MSGSRESSAHTVLPTTSSRTPQIENAKSGIRLVDLRTLLDAYALTDPTGPAQIEQLAKDARKKGW
ncbi:hypothetical protein [Streptomyces sp. CA-253872]|uniref:hypothetical protein n=1 Tax=Streptomyces sp. CA-253872 TaxID=3240067 RepID=UPI003D8CF905